MLRGEGGSISTVPPGFHGLRSSPAGHPFARREVCFQCREAKLPDPSFYSRLGRLSAIMLILPATMGVGWVVGYYLVDYWIGTFPWGSLTFVFLGAGAGFYEIFRILTQAPQ